MKRAREGATAAGLRAVVLMVLSACSLAACTGYLGPETANTADSPEAPDPGDPTTPETPGAPVGSPSQPSASGAALWTQQCANCHGSFGSGSAISTGNANGDFRLDAGAAVQRHGADLEAYIAATMPFSDADECVGECADATGAFIRARQVPVTAAACANLEGPTYGQRVVKLLTSREYQNALEDLLDVPADYGGTVANNDGALGGFVNMQGQAVNGSLMDTYLRNAENVAAWAVANGRPFTCAQPSSCGQRFVDEFLPRAFRGPVSAEQRATYLNLFESFPTDGLQIALEAALSSPQFLYRVEIGVDLNTAREEGYYTNTDYSPTVEITETIAAASFPPGQGRLENGDRAFFENGGVEVRFGTAFTDPSIIEVRARGSNHGAVWPQLWVRVNGHEVGVQTVDSLDQRDYRFEVTGVTGSPTVRLSFDNDSGQPPYGPGQDANLYIAEVRLGTASDDPSPNPNPNPSPDPLAEVSADAFVLTPYEFASALSFMLTGSIPDGRLLEAAQRDQLTTPEQIRSQVERLIDSERGQAHVAQFVSEWFHLDAVEKASRPEVADFTPQVKAAMIREVQEHFAHVFYDDDTPFSEFYGGDYTFLNRTLADFYGIPGNFGDHFVKTTVERRGGPIASGAFMTAYGHVDRSAPILRAVHARQDALCHYIDPPNSPIAGDDIDAQRAAAQMAVTQREMSEGALSSRDFYYLYTDGIDACAGCHERIINPMFGMEDFDQVGRLRPMAGADAVVETVHGVSKTVSLQGTLYGVNSTSDPDMLEYAGAKDFSNKIATTDAVKTCLIRRSFRFLTGLTYADRDLDTARQEDLTMENRLAYGCIASELEQRFEASGESPRAIFVELATESLLRLRR